MYATKKTLAHRCKGYTCLGNNVIIVQGNGAIKTISISKKLGSETRWPQSICLLWLDGRVNKWRRRYDLWDITIIVFNWHNYTLKGNDSLLNVRALKIRSIEKFYLEQGISYQIVTKVVPSIVKSKYFCVRPKVSLDDEVYP